MPMVLRSGRARVMSRRTSLILTLSLTFLAASSSRSWAAGGVASLTTSPVALLGSTACAFCSVDAHRACVRIRLARGAKGEATVGER